MEWEILRKAWICPKLVDASVDASIEEMISSAKGLTGR